MDAGKRLIDDIYNGSRQLVIPFFQRAYVWEEELWLRFLDSMELVSKTGKEYFLGSVIMKQLSTSSSGAVGDIRTVIDGQQRLTTLALFLKVLCFRSDEREFFKSKFFPRKRIALVHNMYDKEVFEEIILQEELSSIDANTKLARAYDFFLQRVTPEKFNLDNILAHVTFVGIDLHGEDDEQVIFDTINSIGVMLTTAELLKNYLFSEDTKEIYLSKWKPTFEADNDVVSYWSSGPTSGKYVRENLDMLLYTYLHIKINDPVYGLTSVQKGRFRTAVDLFSQYKEFMALTQIDREQLIDELVAYAKIYKDNISSNIIEEEVENKYSLERINLIMFGLDTSTMIPYILYLIRNQPDVDERNRIAKILESYVMRRFICRASNDNYSDLFAFSLLTPQFLTADNLKEYLRSKESDSSLRMPDDIELVYAFEKNILNDSRAKGVLYMLESLIRSSKHSTSLRSLKSYTLEHLMPKKWKAQEWPFVGDPEIEKRNIALKTLGNLAIIPQSLNSSVKNSSWQVKLHGNGKKKGLLEYATGLETMKIPLSSENWNETTIRDRSHWLSDHARVVWNFEDVPYEESFADSVVSESNPNSSRQISAHIEKPKRTNNHDRTKYSFDGINFYNKNEFVFRLIKEYMTLHPDTTYKKIRSLFPISIMDNGGSPLSGIVASMSDIMIDVQKGMYREALINKYYKVDNSERQFTTADGITAFVNTQWGKNTLERFIVYAEQIGFNISSQSVKL